MDTVDVYIFAMSEIFDFFSTGAAYGVLIGGIAFLFGLGVAQAVKIIKLA